MQRVRVARMDHLREMDGVWQSQIMVPEPLKTAFGKTAFIQSTAIRNTGPASRKKAAASPPHLQFVADAKTQIQQVRANLAGIQVKLPSRFVEVSRSTMT